MRDLLEKRLREVVEGTASCYGAKATLTYKRDYPVHRNHDEQTAFAAVGRGRDRRRRPVDTDMPPVMGAEDFSFMLKARPGAFIFVGNGDSAGLHHPAYNFNDEVIPVGTSYWVRLVETALRGVNYESGRSLRPALVTFVRRKHSRLLDRLELLLGGRRRDAVRRIGGG